MVSTSYKDTLPHTTTEVVEHYRKLVKANPFSCRPNGFTLFKIFYKDWITGQLDEFEINKRAKADWNELPLRTKKRFIDAAMLLGEELSGKQDSASIVEADGAENNNSGETSKGTKRSRGLEKVNQIMINEDATKDEVEKANETNGDEVEKVNETNGDEVEKVNETNDDFTDDEVEKNSSREESRGAKRLRILEKDNQVMTNDETSTEESQTVTVGNFGYETNEESEKPHIPFLQKEWIEGFGNSFMLI